MSLYAFSWKRCVWHFDDDDLLILLSLLFWWWHDDKWWCFRWKTMEKGMTFLSLSTLFSVWSRLAGVKRVCWLMWFSPVVSDDSAEACAWAIHFIVWYFGAVEKCLSVLWSVGYMWLVCLQAFYLLSSGLENVLANNSTCLLTVLGSHLLLSLVSSSSDSPWRKEEREKEEILLGICFLPFCYWKVMTFCLTFQMFEQWLSVTTNWLLGKGCAWWTGNDDVVTNVGKIRSACGGML